MSHRPFPGDHRSTGKEPQLGEEIETRHGGYPKQDRRMLETAGWKLVEKNSQKRLWRNPESGRLYPQDAAVKLMQAGQVPKNPDGT